MKRIVLFTTTDVQGGRAPDLAAMLASVRRGAPAGLALSMGLLLQRAQARDVAAVRSLAPAGADIAAVPERLSLSDARNRLLSGVPAHALDADTLVGFPDDDCCYPESLLRQLAAAFAADRRIDLLVCRVGLDPVEPEWSGAPLPSASAVDIVRRASSNSMFLRGSLVAGLGAFDPTLGLGTPSRGGEDTDYAVRAFLRARRAVFVDLPLVRHRESDAASVSQYFDGSMQVLARHARRHPRLLAEYLRKFGVGAWLVARSLLTPRAYLAAAAGSVGQFVRGAPGPTSR